MADKKVNNTSGWKYCTCNAIVIRILVQPHGVSEKATDRRETDRAEAWLKICKGFHMTDREHWNYWEVKLRPNTEDNIYYCKKEISYLHYMARILRTQNRDTQ